MLRIRKAGYTPKIIFAWHDIGEEACNAGKDSGHPSLESDECDYSSPATQCCSCGDTFHSRSVDTTLF